MRWAASAFAAASRSPIARPAPAAPPAAVDKGPGESALGVPLFPAAQFLASYNAGRGQRYYLFGTTGSFLDVVTFYRNALKQKGDLVFDAPATHEFIIGRYREETMAFPPSVTVKDYSTSGQGYLFVDGTKEKRFKTIIQIVPAQVR